MRPSIDLRHETIITIIGLLGAGALLAWLFFSSLV